MEQHRLEAAYAHKYSEGRVLIVTAQKVYPPKSNTDLRNLWQKVAKADVSDQMKQAVLFYVLRDCRQPSSIDALFVRKVHLPPQYEVLVMGLWELDHLQFSRALEHLTDPTLTPEFADEVLLTLLNAPKCDNSLAMAYYLAVQPPLAKQETLDAYFKLLVETSIVGAFRFCQGRDISVHKALFEELIYLVHETEGSSTRPERLVTLLSLSFTHDEEKWFEEYLSRGSGSKIAGAKDSIIMRRICTGQSIVGNTALDRYRGTDLNNINWDDVRVMERATIT